MTDEKHPALHCFCDDLQSINQSAPRSMYVDVGTPISLSIFSFYLSMALALECRPVSVIALLLNPASGRD